MLVEKLNPKKVVRYKLFIEKIAGGVGCVTGYLQLIVIDFFLNSMVE